MDRDLAGQLYETYYMRLYSYAITLTKNQNEAEEITQEAFFRAMTTSKTFQGDSEIFTWLCAIAKNLFYDHLRKHSKEGSPIADDEPDESDDLQESVAEADMSFRIHKILHGLDEPYREVFELRVFGELSFRRSVPSSEKPKPGQESPIIAPN